VFKPDLSSGLIVLIAVTCIGAGASLHAHGGFTQRRGKLEGGAVHARRELMAISGEHVCACRTT